MRNKSRFFSNISHDLRTPLTLLSGYTHQIKNDVTSILSPKMAMNLTRIESNIETLKHMSYEIRDLILLEGGKLKLKLEVIEINTYLRNLVNMFASTAEEKDMELIYSSDLKAELKVHIDRLKFNQLIYNLLSNGFKYSPPGSRVSVHLNNQVTMFRFQLPIQGRESIRNTLN
ncbi:MAG: hypothetical protein O2887_05215 [Bacteroidetes bacterium]|nr:hypothetical protein [Bacteroidota bacterium]MDA1119881.1 hypothetical protein [Bacteroidota bacterium]